MFLAHNLQCSAPSSSLYSPLMGKIEDDEDDEEEAGEEGKKKKG